MLTRQVDRRDGQLVASGLGSTTGGGVYAIGPGGADRLADASTTGFAVAPDGRRLARLLWTDDDPDAPGELVIHDAGGVLAYRRLDAVREPHGLLWVGDDELAIVSTMTNAILWLDGDGRERRRWRAPASGDGDCWHLNDLVLHDGRLLAAAFGRFQQHRGWAVDNVREGAGIVFDVATGEDVLAGLTCPHDPTPLDGAWLVCDSASRRLLRVGPGGEVAHAVDLGGFTRGLAYDADRVYVGVSAHRLAGVDGHAAVAVLDRATLAEVDRWPLPTQEVYGLAFVPPALVAGLRRGFARRAPRAVAA